jgi:hypothetical protein
LDVWRSIALADDCGSAATDSTACHQNFAAERNLSATETQSQFNLVTMRGADPRYLSSPSAAGVMQVDQDQLTAGDFD